MQYKAFLFDLNGTMINDMPYHIAAWQQIVNELGANLSYDEMQAQCYGKNEELLERIFPNRFSLDEKHNLGVAKEKAYRIHFVQQLKLIDGLEDFLLEAHHAGIKMAIGSAAMKSNIDFVVDGTKIRHLFEAFVSADDVVESKPNPDTFLRCAELLNIPPSECLVFEDSIKGVESANRADMDVFVITLTHDISEFSQFMNIVGHGKNYVGLSLLGESLS